MKSLPTNDLDFLQPLEPIDSSSLVDKVEIQLIKFFLNNNYRPGDAIPKELELAASLKVSRTVIREALLRLRMTGLIESKKHRGAVLSNPDLLSLLQKTLYPTMLDEKTLRDIFEMRLVLEIGMANLIVERIKPEDIKELQKIVKDEPDVSDFYIFNADHEVNFHGRLYEITGNETLKRFQTMLLPIFKYVHESGILKKMIKSPNYISHKGIVEVIKKRDAELLRNAMQRHFENHFKRLF
jgi:GntR family transcriptional regulator, transcriptional repressor for pyruvate dehydrogenase complex